jgi:putative SOS response-associated peptidase YedK
MNRFTQPFDALSLAQRFEMSEPSYQLTPRFNVGAGRLAAAILGDENGRELEFLRWGLIPFWTPTSDVEAGHRLLSARAETLTKRAAFREALTTRRCIVPAGGWFHRARREGEQATFYVQPANDKLWSFAGLWDEWVAPDGTPRRTLAIVSTEANSLLAPLHARMPAILKREDEAAWLNPKNHDARALSNLLRPFASREMQIAAVRAPRWPAQDDASMIEARADSAKILSDWNLSAQTKITVPRRVVRRDWVSPDRQVFFKSRSWTREDGTRWHPVVDCQHGEVWCDCPDFRYRHARHEPSVHTPIHWCKHLMRAVDNCVRHGELRRA